MPIELYVLWIMASDYLFGVFKLFSTIQSAAKACKHYVSLCLHFMSVFVVWKFQSSPKPLGQWNQAGQGWSLKRNPNSNKQTKNLTPVWDWFTQYTPLQFLQTKTSHDQKSVKCINFIHWLPFYFWQTIKSEIWLRVVFNTHDNNISDFLDYFLLISIQNVYKCIVKDLKTKHLHFIMITSLYFTQKC